MPDELGPEQREYLGFFATRFFEANTKEEAEQLALEWLRGKLVKPDLGYASIFVRHCAKVYFC